MARWFAEYECDTHAGALFWLPLYLEAPDEATAAGMSARVEAALGERYSVTRSTGPRPAVPGHGVKLLAVYGVTGRPGRRALLDPAGWELRPIPGRPPLDLSAPLELLGLRADARLEQTVGLSDPRRLPVRVVTDEPFAGRGPLLVVSIARRAAAGGAG